MRIKEVACQQFAGIQNRRVSLEPGINVVFGPNESGKSTLVNLISRTLFQNAKIDGRKDKDFKEQCFPSAKRGRRAVGDFIDGEITLEAGEECYTLKKEWGSDPRCTLSTPDGLIRKQETIDGEMKQLLLYGEGVYSELLLTPQGNVAESLKNLLKNDEKTPGKTELLEVISQVFAESDGISMDAIGSAIQGKIADIAGKHWDEAHGAPVRKAGRWSAGLGSILTAYYAVEDAKSLCDSLKKKEDAVFAARKNFQSCDSAYTQAKEEYKRFRAVSHQLILRETRKQQQENLEERLKKLSDDTKAWEKAEDALGKAEQLQKERAQRETLEQYQAVLAIQKELEAVDQSILEGDCPTDEEIRRAEKALREIQKLENKLCGMNLTADVTVHDGHELQIRSVRTGCLLEPEKGKVSLTEAVTITIPGVMDMVLAPANVDVQKTEAEIQRLRADVAAIFGRYEVDSLEALQEYANRYQDIQSQVKDIQGRLEQVLAGRRLEELHAAVSDNVRPGEAILADIQALCGKTALDIYVALQKAKNDGYIKDYGTMEALKEREKDCAEELKALQAQTEESIPGEYQAIRNPEEYLKKLQDTVETKQNLRDTANSNKTGAEKELEMMQERLEEDPEQQLQEAQRVFEETKSLLAHWRHIQGVFEDAKESLQANPTAGLAQSFAQYLSRISDGSVQGEMPDGEKLDTALYSKDRLLDYGKLSEGTKDTVALAYRLAVLDQLFPEGGGIIVLDDSFTDMDAQRTAQSVELVKECAQRHQVIFLTCKEDLARQLEGNLIRL